MWEGGQVNAFFTRYWVLWKHSESVTHYHSTVKCPVRGLRRIEEFLTSKSLQVFHRTVEIQSFPATGDYISVESEQTSIHTTAMWAPLLALWKEGERSMQASCLPYLCKFSIKHSMKMLYKSIFFASCRIVMLQQLNTQADSLWMLCQLPHRGWLLEVISTPRIGLDSHRATREVL